MVSIDTEIKIKEIADNSLLFGELDSNAKSVEKAFDVVVGVLDGCLKIKGKSDDVVKAKHAVENMNALIAKGENLNRQTVEYIISMVKEGKAEDLNEFRDDCICATSKGRPIKPKTIGQKKYIESIKNNTVSFGIGPAGTGKTFLAVAAAVAAFKRKETEKIVLTRPAVEAGESLGFLPGDLQNKVDPYLRPLNDALFEMLGALNCQKYLDRGSLEIAPLAYMRGRTLNDSYIILDEAQNTTKEQMKMFLTRIGIGSKAVITGDITQIDLDNKEKSGLLQAIKILDGIEDISIVRFSRKDVVRNRIVKEIIKAYESFSERGNRH